MYFDPLLYSIEMSIRSTDIFVFIGSKTNNVIGYCPSRMLFIILSFRIIVLWIKIRRFFFLNNSCMERTPFQIALLD